MSQTAPTEKRPRHYAAEIVALKSRESRAAALARVPANFRAWVQDLVDDYDWRHDITLPAVGCAPRTAAPTDKAAGQRALSSLRGALA
jgi:hypothetical protein